MRKSICRALVALFTTGLFYFSAVPTAESTDVPNLSGKWVGYYSDGSKSEYVWAIRQTDSTLSIENVGGKTAKSRGRIEGDKVFAQDFATQNGKLSADGTRITWTDGVVWKRSTDVADLHGKWVGYYEDGSKSQYVWKIRQTDSTLWIENVGGKTAKSKGRVEGDSIFAQDFATQNGKLSADGTRITWTDGIVWKRMR